MTTPEDTHVDAAAEPAAPAEGDVAAELAGIHARLDDLADAVAGLRTDTEKLDEYRRLRARDSDMIDQLHRENVELSRDQLTKAMTPLFHGFIKLYDLIQQTPADERNQILLGQLVQILELNGVTVYAPEPGERFDSRRQEGVATPPTDQPEADATVARLRRAGFLRAGAVIRAAQVEVFSLRQPADSSTAR